MVWLISMCCTYACIFFPRVTAFAISSSVKYAVAAAEMPDAMELIFQKALAVGTSGAVSDQHLCCKRQFSCSFYKYINAGQFLSSFR